MSFTQPKPIRTWVDAVYRPQDVPAYQNNRLIEALPPILDDAAAVQSLTYIPRCGPEERKRPTHERIHRVIELKNFTVPLDRHLELSTTVGLMIRGGYVGRSLRTEDSAKSAQQRYEQQMFGAAYQQVADSSTPQLSGKLLGLSGMGKSSVRQRILAGYPQVIYHPEEHVYQVTHLTVEAPTDGTSLRGLCHAIIGKLDSVLPGSSYLKEYGGKGRDSAEAAKVNALDLVERHFLGLLVVEESQNFDKSNKGARVVMAELTSFLNDLRMPTIWVGTNAAKSVLNLDFRQARRSAGMPISYWDRLKEQPGAGEAPEWRQFVTVLWKLQWVRNPVALDELILLRMYEYSQGILMLAIGLLFCAQLTAMRDGTETVDAELIEKMYYQYFEPDLGVMIKALRDGDYAALRKFDDIKPFLENTFERALQDATRPAPRPKPQAQPASQESEPPPIHDQQREPGSVPKKSERKSPARSVVHAIPDLSNRTSDYRNAIVVARASGTSISEELHRLDMAPSMIDVIDID